MTKVTRSPDAEADAEDSSRTVIRKGRTCDPSSGSSVTLKSAILVVIRILLPSGEIAGLTRVPATVPMNGSIQPDSTSPRSRRRFSISVTTTCRPSGNQSNCGITLLKLYEPNRLTAAAPSGGDCSVQTTILPPGFREISPMRDPFGEKPNTYTRKVFILLWGSRPRT